MAISLLGEVINLNTLGMAALFAAVVIVVGALVARGSKKAKKKPGMYSEYTVPGRTAAECKGLLLQPEEEDIFRYTLESIQGGGFYLTLLFHRPTGQELQTVFGMEFVAEQPAVFKLWFVREAFGMREPVVPPALMQEFFAKKLGAVLKDEQAADEGAGPE